MKNNVRRGVAAIHTVATATGMLVYRFRRARSILIPILSLNHDFSENSSRNFSPAESATTRDNPALTAFNSRVVLHGAQHRRLFESANFEIIVGSRGISNEFAKVSSPIGDRMGRVRALAEISFAFLARATCIAVREEENRRSRTKTSSERLRKTCEKIMRQLDKKANRRGGRSRVSKRAVNTQRSRAPA